MGWAQIIFQMETLIQDNIDMENRGVKENIYGQQEPYILGNFQKAKRMVLEDGKKNKLKMRMKIKLMK